MRSLATPLLLVGFALLVRVVYLLPSLDGGNRWKWDALWGLAAELSQRGTLADFDYAALRMSQEAVVRGWLYADRGLYYVHHVLGLVFGRASFALLQSVQVVLDALMVLPIYRIGRLLGGRVGAVASGLVFALFLPEIMLAAMPGYDPWLTYGLILGTLLYLEVVLPKQPQPAGKVVACLAGIGVVLFLITGIRSVIALFAGAMIGWTLLIELVARPRDWRIWLPRVGSLAVVMLAVVGATSLVNLATRGQASPVRSTLGHAFWTGVGEYPNPYVPESTDGAVAEFYQRESGAAAVDDMSLEYNGWLQDRAKRFIREHPALYAEMVGRRVLRSLAPNFRIAWRATAPINDDPELASTARRQAIVARDGMLSRSLFAYFLFDDPGYMAALICRVVLMLALPIGLLACLAFGANWRQTLLATIPLAYIVVVTGPIYVTPLVLASAWAAVVPVVAIGWVGIGRWIMRRRPALVAQGG